MLRAILATGLIQSLREKHINVVNIKPDRDKQSRLISQIDLFEGGSILLPKDAPWLEEFVAELLSFAAVMTTRLTHPRTRLVARGMEAPRLFSERQGVSRKVVWRVEAE